MISDWADSTRPPEIIQIGIILFQINKFKILKTFERYVKPYLNPVLSDYCKNLLKIGQDKIDRAKSFPHISNEIFLFLKKNTSFKSIITCAWGYEDRIFFSEDSTRNDCQNPFNPFPHLDLMRNACRLIGKTNTSQIEREEFRQKMGQKNRIRNHDALDDAYDLLELFHSILKSSN